MSRVRQGAYIAWHCCCCCIHTASLRVREMQLAKEVKEAVRKKEDFLNQQDNEFETMREEVVQAMAKYASQMDKKQ